MQLALLASAPEIALGNGRFWTQLDANCVKGQPNWTRRFSSYFVRSHVNRIGRGVSVPTLYVRMVPGPGLRRSLAPIHSFTRRWTRRRTVAGVRFKLTTFGL